jgi:Cu+-exporting ATPase
MNGTDQPPAARSSLDLEISGMTCASCVARVEKALKRVPGVLGAEVNLATNRARVVCVPEQAGMEALAVAVRKAGFDAAPAHGEIGVHAPEVERRERRRLLAAALLSAPLLAGMAGHAAGLPWMLPGWAQAVLASVVQFWLGGRFYVAGFKAVRAGAGNMDLLVALGTTAAWALSSWNLLAAAPGHAPALYYESSAVLITFILFGKWLESRAKGQTAAALAALAGLRPEVARLRTPQGEQTVPIAHVVAGDLVLVRPGERVPVDGVVLEGTGSADESMLTGESLPVEKAPGEKLIAGSILADGACVLRATAVGAETVLAQIVRLVENAQASKPPIQRQVDRVSAVFVPVVLLAALATAVGWALAGGSVATAVLNAVAVLVIACPCALGLATPTAIMAGTGAAARSGILIRDAAVLERARAVNTVVFDKTGTLTEGRPELVAVLPAPGEREETVLAMAAALVAQSEHPLAEAVRRRAPPAATASGFTALPGRGVRGRLEERELLLGSPRALAEAGIDAGALAAEATQQAAAGRTLSWLAEIAPNPRPLALLAFGDAPRPTARAAVARLRRAGLSVVLLSGDVPGAAAAVAAAVGIDQVLAEVLPGQKAEQVAALKSEGAVVAMVGDGVNDAPALAAADVGIAMGSGSDVAMQTAGITLIRADPALVAPALEIARRTHATIRQGLFWAFAYNVIGIPLAASGMLSPLIAGTAMALSSVSVVSNALRLRRWRAAIDSSAAKA